MNKKEILITIAIILSEIALMVLIFWGCASIPNDYNDGFCPNCNVEWVQSGSDTSYTRYKCPSCEQVIYY